MGGLQSTEEGSRVITVEAGSGETDVTLTEDFIRHVSGCQDGGRRKKSKEEESGSHPHEDQHREPTDWIPRSEEVVGYGMESTVRWRQLYEEEKAKNEELSNISKESFESAANAIRDQFACVQMSRSNLATLVPVCEDCKEEVLSCYRRNPNKSLNCSAEVKAYARCVERARKSLYVQTLSVDGSPQQ